MSTKPRRSSRIAEMQAVKAAEEGLPTSTTTTKETAGLGSAKEREGPGDDGQASLEGSLEDLSEQSSDSGRRPARAPKGEDFLRDYFTYDATKALLPVPVPLPFRICNPDVLKEPKLWPLLFDVLGVVSTDLVTPAGFDGDVIKAFVDSAMECYRRPESSPNGCES